VLSAGLLPTYLTPVPGSEDAPSALVINVGSSDVTRFVVNKDGVDTDTIAVHTGANRWAMSEDWAVAYSAPEPGQKLDPTEGLQEITVIALGDKLKATRLAVGYRPSHLQISSDQKRLVVVSETDISVIQLGDKPKRADWVDLGFEAEKRDVSLSADGNFALVRRTDEQTVQIFDLRDPDQAVEVTFSGHVTDLDLSASGRGLAVIRSKDEIATFMLNDILEDPTNFDSLKIESELFGSAALTEDGKTAILYTTAVAHEFVNIVDLRPGDTYLAHRKLDTQSPVYSVTTAPDGKHAVILAATMDGGRGNAFSVVSLRNERFPRVVGAAATLSQVALANDFGIVTAASEQLGIYEAHVLNLPSLSVSSVDLSTKPLSAGVMAEFSVAYAAQQHPEGRVTFFDLAADQVRTLSGFELSAEVVDR
jgi:DNA-binding beta-propeller fold protein YncE